MSPFFQAADLRKITWRDRQRQNGHIAASQYGSYYGRPAFESADEALDESEFLVFVFTLALRPILFIFSPISV